MDKLLLTAYLQALVVIYAAVQIFFFLSARKSSAIVRRSVCACARGGISLCAALITMLCSCKRNRINKFDENIGMRVAEVN